MRCAIILLLTLQCAFGASVFYVGIGGNDANNGTSTSTPWKTVPGTRLTNDSGFVSAAWGAINTTDRITDNTTINIQAGYILSGTNGGYVQFSPNAANYYSSGCTNIVIQTDLTWGPGTGNAVFTGVGVDAGIGGFRIQVDGIKLKNLDVRNWVNEGVEYKEKPGASAPLTNCTVESCNFFNNCNTNVNDVDGAGKGQLNFRHAYNVLVTNCVFNGNGVTVNGILFGNNHQVVVGTVVDCISTNHHGDITDNDAGIGYKALNGTIDFIRCTSAWNLKGYDLGEQSGFDAGPGGTPADITYKVINSTATNNYWGMNANSAGEAPYPGTVKFYFINNIVCSNAVRGFYIYSGPFEAHIVHNILDNNGGDSSYGPDYIRPQIEIDTALTTDTNRIVAHVYNNIIRRSKGLVFSTGYYLTNSNDMTWDIDYNSYEQEGTELFAQWAWNEGAESVTYSFGSGGPGHASGDWYSNYGKTSTLPVRGTGHFHCDAHSVGTGCDNTAFAVLEGYTLANTSPGAVLSEKSWYISEMGFNRDGTVRGINWDMGPQDADPTKIFNSGPQKIRGLRLFK